MQAPLQKQYRGFWLRFGQSVLEKYLQVHHFPSFSENLLFDVITNKMTEYIVNTLVFLLTFEQESYVLLNIFFFPWIFFPFLLH